MKLNSLKNARYKKLNFNWNGELLGSRNTETQSAQLEGWHTNSHNIYTQETEGTGHRWEQTDTNSNRG